MTTQRSGSVPAIAAAREHESRKRVCDIRSRRLRRAGRRASHRTARGAPRHARSPAPPRFASADRGRCRSDSRRPGAVTRRPVCVSARRPRPRAARTSAGSPLYGTSTTIVPSRSTMTASTVRASRAGAALRCTTRPHAAHRSGDGRDEHTRARHAGDLVACTRSWRDARDRQLRRQRRPHCREACAGPPLVAARTRRTAHRPARVVAPCRRARPCGAPTRRRH